MEVPWGFLQLWISGTCASEPLKVCPEHFPCAGCSCAPWSLALSSSCPHSHRKGKQKHGLGRKKASFSRCLTQWLMRRARLQTALNSKADISCMFVGIPSCFLNGWRYLVFGSCKWKFPFRYEHTRGWSCGSAGHLERPLSVYLLRKKSSIEFTFFSTHDFWRYKSVSVQVAGRTVIISSTNFGFQKVS